MLFVGILFSCLFTLNCKSVKNVQNVLESVRTKKLHDPFGESRQPRQTQDESDKNNNYYYDDGYVMEDMSLVQNDQPAYMRKSMQQNVGQKMQMESPDSEPKRRIGSMPGNLQFTKEILIKQGRLRGYVRQMHPQTGLKNVRQYLGIPYAAAPIANGRFMPPGLFTSI